ncbi:efflux RND transporter periplasmic adaptor subunit [Halorhodospira neutriphila]|uniref:Efflux transporter, RND family, MFP subunit n=1 Tax=Halorhodospira neutriphila TaxID=168379 RepID=A0ABS1E5H0_9GAMM|nr:efflux RND transporter periplasmic adaptor subunit [Halorhodospira neutriphila]MBK1726352.1 hypothetical protein [Halorhodospira neutriphila]
MIRLLSIAALALGAGAALAAPPEIPISAAQMERLGVATEPVATAEGGQAWSLPARVAIPPSQERVVSAPQGGLVAALHAAPEEAVAAGELLAELHSPGLVEQQRAFLQALSAKGLAEAALERDRQLLDDGVIAERRFQETRSRFQQARADLEAQRQGLDLSGMAPEAIERLEQSQQMSARLRVRSPLDGVVVARAVSTGDRVQSAQALYRVARLDPLWLELRVPEDRLQGVDEQSRVHVACADAEAPVVLVGRTADPESQTVLVRAEISAEAPCLRPGQMVEARLASGAAASARLQVPKAAVVRNRGEDWVFVRTPRGFRPTPVTVHGHRGGAALLSGELRPGQAVAVRGVAALKGAWSGYGGAE